VLTENPGVFVKDFGVPCTCVAYPFTGILNAPGETLNMGGVNVISSMYVLEVLSSDVAGGAIASGSVITVTATVVIDGTAVVNPVFTVRDVLSTDDGVFTHLTLSK
jgi:hypothetical protein